MFARILRFPAESLGELLDERFRDWPKVAEAQGDVEICGRPKLVLRLAEPPIQWYSPLTPSDSLYGIRLAFSPLRQGDLPFIFALRGLRLLDLCDSGVGDDMFLGLLTGLPYLRSVDFGGTLVSDFALRDMPQLMSLRILRTLGRRVPVGDRGAIAVGTKMPRLVTLDLSKTDVGDEGVRGLTHLRLRFLNMLGTRVTDAGIASMAGMHSLRKLVLSFTKISDASLYFIQAMTRLTLLMLDGTGVTDEGLSYILKLSSLTVLYLNGTHITENATKWLAQMTRLRVLAVGQQLSADSVEHLRRALPNCRISALN
jgi:hypothetical protein